MLSFELSLTGKRIHTIRKVSKASPRVFLFQKKLNWLGTKVRFGQKTTERTPLGEKECVIGARSLLTSNRNVESIKLF